jgi:heat shock protein HtpX
MNFMKRITLMLLVNVGIIVTLSLLLNLLGVGPYLQSTGMDYGSLMVFCLVWGMGGSFIALMISKPMAKWAMGVRTFDGSVQDPGLRNVYEMVRRSAERAGLKTPEVGVYQSPEMNAFATGATRNNALVAVSSGLLQSMDKDEVEGVIGHEVSHIANGDMVTMALVQGVVNAMVMFLARIIAFAVSSSVEERSRHTVRWVVIMLCEIVLGILGVMVTAWFSRHREFRADAGSARLTSREKMISALEALGNRSRVLDDRAPQLQAFKISGKRSGGLMALMMTHPPIEERIDALRRSKF